MSAPTTRQWLRTAADRVSTGSRRLVIRHLGRVLRAVRRRAGTWPWWLQLGLAFLALYRGPELLARLGDRVHDRIASGAWAWLLTVTTCLWLTVAYRAGRDPHDEDEAPAEAAEHASASDAHETPPEQASEEPPLPLLVDLRVSLARVGTPHAHITVLAEDLGTTTERVREALARWDIPVEPVRMKGRGSSTGVKGGTHPALTPSPEDVVAAGKPANNDNNNASGGPPREGLTVEPIGLSGSLVRDPAEAVRHHQVHGR